MTFKVITEAEAAREWREAVLWYEQREAGLGTRFNQAIYAVTQSLAINPDRFPRVGRLTHKAKVPPPWPYSVYFAVNAARCEVNVLAIWHGARNPAALRRRLK